MDVDGYQVFRNNIKIADVSETTYQDLSVTAREQYTYTVKAYSGSSTSVASNEATVTIPSENVWISGTKITGVNDEKIYVDQAFSSLKAVISASNYTGSDQKVQAVLAVYKGNTLIALSQKEFLIPDNAENLPEDFTVENLNHIKFEDGYRACLYVFGSFDSLKPLTGKMEFSGEPKVTHGTVPQSQMTVTASSASGTNIAQNAIDNNPSTWWLATQTVAYENYLVFDLGDTYNINKFRYLPIPGGYTQTGDIRGFRIKVSTNGADYETAATGSFPNSYEGNRGERSLEFDPVPARYVRIEFNWGRGNANAAAEINFEY